MLRENPDRIFVFGTITAPLVDDLGDGVQTVTTALRQLLRSRSRSKKSAWAAVRGTVRWLDFGSRADHSGKLLAHVHFLAPCDTNAIASCAAAESDRRGTQGLPAFRPWTWQLFAAALRRDARACYAKLLKQDKNAMMKENGGSVLSSFFHVRLFDAHDDGTCETFVPGDHFDVLSDVYEVGDYSTGTSASAPDQQMTSQQRVAIQCLEVPRHRGCSGELYGIPGIQGVIRDVREIMMLLGRVQKRRRERSHKMC